MMKALLAVLLAVVLVGGGVAVALLVPGESYSNEQLRTFGFIGYPQARPIAAFDLADAGGGRFTPERLEGRWSLLFFGYANCPDICPITMSVLGEAERELLESGDTPFQGVMVTVDPQRDSPEALSAYVGAFSERFIGVTGEAPALRAFAGSLHAGFSRAPAPDSAIGYLMDHTSHIAILDPGGRHYGYIRSPQSAEGVATLMRALMQRGAGG